MRSNLNVVLQHMMSAGQRNYGSHGRIQSALSSLGSRSNRRLSSVTKIVKESNRGRAAARKGELLSPNISLHCCLTNPGGDLEKNPPDGIPVAADVMRFWPLPRITMK